MNDAEILDVQSRERDYRRWLDRTIDNVDLRKALLDLSDLPESEQEKLGRIRRHEHPNAYAHAVALARLKLP